MANHFPGAWVQEEGEEEVEEDEDVVVGKGWILK
jgi:hypothetical protein